MQTDGNLVEYDLYTGQPLWATMTNGNSGAWAVLQSSDGNFVVYSSSNRALWYSHTNPYNSDYLTVQNDGNVVIYNGSTWLWATGQDQSEQQCWTSNSCAPNSFAYTILGQWPEAPTTGVNAPTLQSNIYAISRWEATEGGGGGCGSQTPGPWPLHYNTNPPYGPSGNPLATTQSEPGATTWNSVGVKSYHDASGQTCWYWGAVATDQTLLNGRYQNVLNVLRSPSIDNRTQCVNLARAVGSSPWGTGDFEGNC